MRRIGDNARPPARLQRRNAGMNTLHDPQKAHAATLDRLRLIAAFAVVYLVWSSTYLFIRIGVTEIPPALLAGLRFVIAGGVLAGLGLARGGALPRGRDWITMGVLALGLVVGGNGVVTWAEQWVPSGETAFIVSSSALFTAGFGTLGRRGEKLTAVTLAGLALGFTGTALMLLPRLHGQHGPLLPALALVGSACGWSASAMYARSAGVKTAPLVFSGLEMILGGVILLGIAGGTGDFGSVRWGAKGLAALAYLTVFGSAVTYTTYNWLIHHTSPAQLGTVSYVNPAIALFLGWAVLGEVLPPTAFAGVGVMLAGVVLVNLRRRLPRRGPLVKPGTGA